MTGSSSRCHSPSCVSSTLHARISAAQTLRHRTRSEWAPAPSSSFALKIATFGTTTKSCCDGAIRVKSDLFQTTWDVTSAHRGDLGDSGGMLCFWSGGSQAERAGALDLHELANGCLAEAEKRFLRGLAKATSGPVK